MSIKKQILFGIGLAVIIGMTACSAKPTPQATPTAEVINFITETTLPAVENTALPTATATPAPTATATLQPTPTVEVIVQPTANNVPDSSDVSLTLAFNTVCRKGPATVYHSVVTIPAGIKVKVAGKLAGSDEYYYVENPNDANSYCWVYSQGASPEGNLALLPKVEPLPSPTPETGMNFSVTYSKIQLCGGDDYSFSYIVTNTDDLVWQSIKVHITDVSNGVSSTYHSNRFEENTKCQLDNDRDELAKGEHVYMTPYNPGHFDYAPYGKTFNIRVTLCSEDDLEGTCMTKEIRANP